MGICWYCYWGVFPILMPLQRYVLMSFHFVPLLNSFVIVDFNKILRYINVRNTRAKALANARFDSKMLVSIGKTAQASNQRQFSLFFFILAISYRPTHTALNSSHQPMGFERRALEIML